MSTDQTNSGTRSGVMPAGRISIIVEIQLLLELRILLLDAMRRLVNRQRRLCGQCFLIMEDRLYVGVPYTQRGNWINKFLKNSKMIDANHGKSFSL